MSDMYENIKNGKYQNKVKIEDNPRIPEILKRPASLMTSAEIQSLPEVKKQWEEAEERYRKSMQEYRQEESRIYGEFEADCAAEEGLLDHPKRSALFSKAWEAGHSSGYNEVWLNYTDMAELLKP
jgi:hypothetical protein